MIILGIETSCDESSASVVRLERGELDVLSVATYSQIKIHQPYGGVVPEIASRNHLETLNPMVEQALRECRLPMDEMDAIAVTNRPGLVGALLVGVSVAKAMAYALRRPLIPVHHLEGHATSLFLDQEPPVEYPLLLAIVSGGHTNLHVVKKPPTEWPEDILKTSLVGRSRDDAAGEAFDKTAKLMGFPYPGGVYIDRESKGGDPGAFALPRALPQKNTLDYSFSGLKTAVSLVVQRLEKEKQLDARLADLCASVQEAIVDALINKIFLAVRNHGCRSIAIVGGVAANSRLRAVLEEKSPVPYFFPFSKYCTDNAAMIAGAGAFRFEQGKYLKGNALLQLNALASAEN